ncbi:hypothetical protein GGI12_004036 [Dipsacomyces acuminosporus]|nr:hypothetical protein GGI12_004036 [Dipsacomyces acuminosporus]
MTSKGAASNSIPLAGMSSAGHANDDYTEETHILPSKSAQLYCEGHRSAAPHMTNANYRVLPPAPGAAQTAAAAAAATATATATAAASAGGGMPAAYGHGSIQAEGTALPSWTSPVGAAKTYFPAHSSPMLGHGTESSDSDAIETYASGRAVYGPDGSVNGALSRQMSVDDLQELRTEYDTLPYEIHAWSSHSANFLPHNVLVDRPHDQASRWSTNANNHRQYITLRLEHPALVRSIKFGKFYKTHVCNLKEFKVFGGMSPDNMMELLYSGLRNDSEPETISLKQKFSGYYIPCQYIKIQPLLAHDQKFNFSIWFVELSGTMDPRVMQPIINQFAKLKEHEVLRSCLKFFRDRRYTAAFSALQQQTQVCLEAPLLTMLHEALVEKGDYDQVEQLLCQAEREGMFSDCISRIPYGPVWNRMCPDVYPVPPARGGHQMCVDEDKREAYLYGGWDGANNLGDLWVLKMETGMWRCISSNTRDQGGPGPRSCHAMCFDSVNKCLYIMGRYIDHEYRGNTGLENDLFCYDTVNSEWMILSENTEVLGGPKLVFNAQMVFDSRYCCIYVYGGKVVLPDANDSTYVYSGMYRFDLRRHKWTRLRPDFHMLEQDQHLRGRYFHTMQIDSENQRLYILSSKRDVSSPSDLFIYDIAADTFYERMQDLAATTSTKHPMTQQRYLAERQRLNPAYSAVHARPPPPPPDSIDHHPHHVHLVQDGRTIRATLDTERQELYVLAAVQNESNPQSPTSLQTLMSAMRGGSGGIGDRSTPPAIYCTGDVHSSQGSYAYLAGAGFHPCSSLIDSGARYESRRHPFASAAGGSGRGSEAASHRYSEKGCAAGAGNHHGHQMQQEHVIMVVMCYHIPTETWTEVYSSERTPLALAAGISAPAAGDTSDSLSPVDTTEKHRNINSIPSSRPAFGYSSKPAPGIPELPVSRFAHDWVYDRTTHRHFMFGGNPNRPNDKSARFNDTWELQFSRPSSQDILRRALYLVRQRRFLDMCTGVESAELQTPRNGESVVEDTASYHVDEFKASAIPSPNSALADVHEPESTSAKRSLPPTRGAAVEHHHRQKLAATSSMDVSLAASASSIAQPFTSTARSLAYLQQQIAPLVNYADPSEGQSFHALSTALFQISSAESSPAGAANHGKTQPSGSSATSPEDLCRARADVYEALLFYFPRRQQQPSSQLDDAFPMMLS